MAVRDLPIIGDDFRVGFRFQRYWDTSMANAFFAGELGAGTFIVSLLFNFPLGMLVGLLITCVGKTYFHLTHMGVPQKSWRALLRPDRSWISRGLIGIVVYGGFGFIHIVNTWFGLDLPLGGLIKVIAAAAALVVMTYQGFAMSHSTAIALWSTAVMPISSLVYAVTGGVMLTLVLGWSGVLADDPGSRGTLVHAALILLVVITGVLLSLLHAAHHGSPGGQKSVELLTKSFYAKWFYSMIWGVGLIVPAALLWFAGGNYLAVLLAAAGVLVGYYSFRVLIFKAGVFEPIMSFRP